MQKEKKRMEHANAANTKLLHECNLLWDRLQECSVNFLSEEEDKLNVDTSSPSDALDLLTTSDNRIGLLLAEVSFTPELRVMNFFLHTVETLSLRKSWHLEWLFIQGLEIVAHYGSYKITN